MVVIVKAEAESEIIVAKYYATNTLSAFPLLKKEQHLKNMIDCALSCTFTYAKLVKTYHDVR
jgi:hypothetical protein